MSKKKEALPIVSQTQEMVSADHADIRNMIHLIRGQQVICPGDRVPGSLSQHPVTITSLPNPGWDFSFLLLGRTIDEKGALLYNTGPASLFDRLYRKSDKENQGGV